MSDLKTLKALALAATPGPWFAEDWSLDDGPDEYTIAARKKEVLSEGQCSIWPDGMARTSIASTEESDGDRLANAAFIASANPAVILALIERLEAAESAPLPAEQPSNPVPPEILQALRESRDTAIRKLDRKGADVIAFGAIANNLNWAINQLVDPMARIVGQQTKGGGNG